MKIFFTSQIREIDRLTIENEPILSIDLMERAANALLAWFAKKIPTTREIVVIAGPGNNGGDGLALARMLVEIGYNVRVYCLASSSCSPDFTINLNRLVKQSLVNPFIINSLADIPDFESESIIIDALYGSGISRPLEGLSSGIVENINGSGCRIISIDIPSGLFGEENPFPNNHKIVKADNTLTLQFPKLSFFFPENQNYVGSWEVLPIGLHPKAIQNTESFFELLEEDLVSTLLKKRNKFDHKGNLGHCLIIAGSHGMMGAAVLATSACVKSGAGLVTAHIPRLGYSIIQNSVPEALAEIDDNDWFFSETQSIEKYTAIGIGPGIGKSSRTIKAFRELLRKVKLPLVLDADALNIIADNFDLLDLIPKNSIITPHPGEFDRLFGKSENGYSRLMSAIGNAQKYGLIIVVKGAHTQIVCPDGRVYFNSTGNPGMATGGCGDVLTGMITSLLGQGYSPANAAMVGVFIHGLAGDISLGVQSIESLTASFIVDNIGKAFNKLI